MTGTTGAPGTPLHLAVALDGAGWHPAAWREAGARPGELLTAAYWAELVAEAERGLLDMALEEAQAKQYFAAHCAQLFGLVDSSKFGSFSLHTATPVADITALYTDGAADPAVVAALERAGTRVHRVDVTEQQR